VVLLCDDALAFTHGAEVRRSASSQKRWLCSVSRDCGLADPGAASLVSAGDRVDLLATLTTDEGTQVRTVGRDVAVVLAGGSPVADRGGVIGSLGSADVGADLLGGLLVVAASPAQVTSIVAGAAESPLHLVVRPVR
jgi:hypothetical protein